MKLNLDAQLTYSTPAPEPVNAFLVWYFALNIFSKNLKTLCIKILQHPPYPPYPEYHFEQCQHL